jgi:hypothetical protein
MRARPCLYSCVCLPVCVSRRLAGRTVVEALRRRGARRRLSAPRRPAPSSYAGQHSRRRTRGLAATCGRLAALGRPLGRAGLSPLSSAAVTRGLAGAAVCTTAARKRRPLATQFSWRKFGRELGAPAGRLVARPAAASLPNYAQLRRTTIRAGAQGMRFTPPRSAPAKRRPPRVGRPSGAATCENIPSPPVPSGSAAGMQPAGTARHRRRRTRTTINKRRPELHKQPFAGQLISSARHLFPRCLSKRRPSSALVRIMPGRAKVAADGARRAPAGAVALRAKVPV